MVLLAMLPDAAFHSTLLKALAVSRAHGLRFNVGEVKDGGRHVVGRLDRVGGKVGYGAVVVDVKVSDAMMIVVMGKEFTKFFRVIFDKKAYNYGELVNYLTPERESRMGCSGGLFAYRSRRNYRCQLVVQVERPLHHQE